MASPEVVSRGVKTPNGDSLQMVMGSGSRVNATAGSTSTAEAALPAGSKVIEVRATASIAIRFGNTGMSAAAVDANSILFPAGEKAMPVPRDANDAPYDYFRVIRADSTDAAVQIERVNTL